VKYPAVDIRSGSAELVAAIVDDFSPTAVEERSDSLRVFFPTAQSRDAARAALARLEYETASVDVDDENWAARSQAGLTPVTVGRLTISPPWFVAEASPSLIVIQPSTGFGTGHHVTTRLCLEALQTLDLSGRFVLDVGTGSGVLALAADRLGAARTLGIDNDPDAVRSSLENLSLNPSTRQVTFQTLDFTCAGLPTADVLTANLTAALLVREADRLAAAVAQNGHLILSGLLRDETADVRRSFATLTTIWHRDDDGWTGLMMKKP
jgi:ribosomal protein L11 methyltransferase